MEFIDLKRKKLVLFEFGDNKHSSRARVRKGHWPWPTKFLVSWFPWYQISSYTSEITRNVKSDCNFVISYYRYKSKQENRTWPLKMVETYCSAYPFFKFLSHFSNILLTPSTLKRKILNSGSERPLCFSMLCKIDQEKTVSVLLLIAPTPHPCTSTV